MFVKKKLNRQSKPYIMKKLILLPLLTLVFSFASYANNTEEIATADNATTISTQEFVTSAPMLTTYTLFIKLYHGETEQDEARFLFMQDLTLGLDPGYDAGAFNQDTPISSRLPEDDQGTNFELNAMGLDSAFGVAVPLVINQNQGHSFRISISNNTLPENVNVYLEDALYGTFTQLQGQDFELTAEQDLRGVGRFQIHFTTEILGGEVLNTNNIFDTDTVSVFKANNQDFITITGIAASANKTTASLYNMLGMSVRTKTLHNPSQTQSISTQGLAKGVYVVQLKAGNAMFSKKVLLK